MEPGQVEFIDEDGNPVAAGRAEDELSIGPDRAASSRGRRVLYALVAVVVMAGAGVLWHGHAGHRPNSSAAAAPSTVAAPGGPAAPDSGAGYAVDPVNGWTLAEAHETGRLNARMQQRVACAAQIAQEMQQLQSMSAIYRNTLRGGGSAKAAEQAARALLAAALPGGRSSGRYAAMLQNWTADEPALLAQPQSAIELADSCS